MYSDEYTLAERLEAAQRDLAAKPPDAVQQSDSAPEYEDEADEQ